MQNEEALIYAAVHFFRARLVKDFKANSDTDIRKQENSDIQHTSNILKYRLNVVIKYLWQMYVMEAGHISEPYFFLLLHRYFMYWGGQYVKIF